MATPRFLRLSEVAEVLNISMSQTYALVRSGDLRAIQVGGRRQWRVDRDELEKYIERAYEETSAFLRQNPAAQGDPVPED